MGLYAQTSCYGLLSGSGRALSSAPTSQAARPPRLILCEDKLCCRQKSADLCQHTVCAGGGGGGRRRNFSGAAGGPAEPRPVRGAWGPKSDRRTSHSLLRSAPLPCYLDLRPAGRRRSKSSALWLPSLNLRQLSSCYARYARCVQVGPAPLPAAPQPPVLCPGSAAPVPGAGSCLRRALPAYFPALPCPSVLLLLSAHRTGPAVQWPRLLQMQGLPRMCYTVPPTCSSQARLGGRVPEVLIGHSMGGKVVLECVRQLAGRAAALPKQASAGLPALSRRARAPVRPSAPGSG